MAIAFAGLAMGGYQTLKRAAEEAQRRESDRRLADLERRCEKAEAARDALAERQRDAELAQARLEGVAGAALQRIEAIEREHVPRAEWEAKFEGIVDRLDDITKRLDRTPGRYSSSEQPPVRRNTP